MDKSQRLWAISTRFQSFFLNTLNPRDTNFRVFMSPSTTEAVRGTVCDGVGPSGPSGPSNLQNNNNNQLIFKPWRLRGRSRWRFSQHPSPRRLWSPSRARPTRPPARSVTVVNNDGSYWYYISHWPPPFANSTRTSESRATAKIFLIDLFKNETPALVLVLLLLFGRNLSYLFLCNQNLELTINLRTQLKTNDFVENRCCVNFL